MKLKPCPFCGGTSKVFGGGYSQERVSIQCTNNDCMTSVVYGMDKDDAISKWNNRAVQSQPEDC